MIASCEPTTSASCLSRSISRWAFCAGIALASALDWLVDDLRGRLRLSVGVELRVVAYRCACQYECVAVSIAVRCGASLRWDRGHTQEIVQVLQRSKSVSVNQWHQIFHRLQRRLHVVGDTDNRHSHWRRRIHAPCLQWRSWLLQSRAGSTHRCFLSFAAAERECPALGPRIFGGGLGSPHQTRERSTRHVETIVRKPTICQSIPLLSIQLASLICLTEKSLLQVNATQIDLIADLLSDVLRTPPPLCKPRENAPNHAFWFPSIIAR